MSKRKVKIRILDEVSCVLVGLHPDHVDYLHDEYSAFAPNYFFNPKYKLGKWDGKIRYFHKTGKTYVKLLESLIPKLVGLRYEVMIDDLREGSLVQPDPIDETFFNHVTTANGEPWVMRDYQVNLVNALISNGGGVGIAGTGAGKTSMCAALARAYELAGNLRSIIIVPDKNLTKQTKGEYAFFGLDVGEYSGDKKDIDHQHVVSTWQALKNRPELIQQFQVVIVDECHGIRGNVLTNLLNEHGANVLYRFGVTGTLPKEPSDVMSIRVSVGEVQYTIPAHELIDQGYLSKLEIRIIQHSIDLSLQYADFLTEKPMPKPTYNQFKDSYFPDWSSEKKYLQGHEDRLQWIADYITSLREQHKGNVLCLVNGIKFGDKLSELIPDSHFIYGQDDMETRKQVYDLFSTRNDVVAIATVQIASTGLNIPRIFHMVYIDIGRSFIRTIQSIGRGLRRAEDKDSVIVTDICSDLKYSKRHLRERIKYYNEAKYPNKKQVIELKREDYADF